MYRHLCVALLIGLGMAAQTTSADARWNQRGVCKPVFEGVATGKGLFGEGSARARQAAVDNWEAAVEHQYGRAFANFDRAANVRWDCAKNALITAKCVVLARPCASRISG
ncbi:hypothetical protein Hden_2277 [Hyphomicrobium denitrificans ATCC 51888]|uniref:Uncharacterized protein n=1 Tax=Hyphomicrobium denitrificans (strain ATCC 51888 / DSM 1869 / NCIMB 11706 / TK 0415) TaxID=582899 RepID=D8JR90_HYPDA|nr:hypothetical protein [Hyphomicrobium denitrificans]ADJ24075.1 hypothetical protein Hden_2277 [Hyphomicrobium denitrificans ATCC 51888]MBN9354716.1 hypothetical protein [Hyphomicrobium denitrificans]